MEHAPRLHVQPRDDGGRRGAVDAWQLVRSSSLVASAPAKLAWWYLYQDLAGGKPARLATSYTAIAASMGRDPKSARQALTHLVAAGLVDVVQRDDRRGTLLVELAQPADVLGAPSVVCAGDSQHELDFSAAELPAKVPAVLPAPIKDQVAQATKSTIKSETVRSAIDSDLDSDTRGKTAGESAGASADRELHVAAALDAWIAQRRPPARHDAAELLELVGQDLHRAFAERVCDAVNTGAGGLTWADVMLAVGKIPTRDPHGEPIRSRAGYFRAAIRSLPKARSIGLR